MSDAEKRGPSPNFLRRRAEDILRETTTQSPENIEALSPEAARRMLHELHVHQIELEMQNEELRLAQAALEESRSHYVDLYDFAPVAYLTLTREAAIAEVNLTGAALLAVERRTLLRQHFARFVAAGDRHRWHRLFRTVIEEEERQVDELALERADGTDFYAQLDCLRMRSDDGLLAVRITLTDITERKELDAALRKGEAILDAQRLAQLGTWELDPVNNALTWSDEVFRIFEINAQRLGTSYEAFLAAVHPDDRDAVTTAYTQSLRDRTPYELTHRLLMADGRIKYVRCHCRTVYDEYGRPLRSVGTVQDISDQKQAETELSDHAHRLQDLSRRLAQVQETERRQVAGELHDSMGRDLTALAINVDLIRTLLPAQALAGVEERLDDARALIGSAMQNVRSIVAGLRPPLLEEWGLLAALRSHAAELSKRLAIPVEVAAPGDEARLPDEVELALFRVAQEALLNCAKHARARRIDISLEMIPGSVTLTIIDDGVGFILEDLDSGRTIPGLGLALMRERVEAVGGRLHVVSSHGQGTTISAAIKE